MKKEDRRQFLKSALAASGIALLPMLIIGESRRSNKNTAHGKLDELLDRDSAAQIGVRYMSEFEQDSDYNAEMEILINKLGGVQELKTIDMQQLRQRVQACCRQDFKNRNVVRINGWLLAKTEAQICSLAVLA